VLDALKNPERGYFDPRDVHSALPRALMAKEPYVRSLVDARAAAARPLAGVRVGIVREYMVKHVANDAAISDQIDREIKTVLRDKLGAELVESLDPLYPDDPTVPNMRYTFQHALAEILPFHMPGYLSKTTRAGAREFTVPGHDVTTLDYMVKASRGKAPWPDNLNLRRLVSFPPAHTFKFAMNQYLMDRGDDRVKDFVSLNANAKYYSDARRAAMENWQNKMEIGPDGMAERMQMREVFRLVVLKVMHQNRIDVLVNPSFTIPQQKVHGPVEPSVNGRPGLPGSGQTPVLGVPEINVPAGFNRVVYEPRFVLSADKKSYAELTGTVASQLPHAMPISLAFWGGPGDEPVLLRIASAYESATRHRKPPPAFK
jgi:Asp-tRNA(Asn)/Glu-tRNA(Gln) amidotransferase A subunit family amidase